MQSGDNNHGSYLANKIEHIGGLGAASPLSYTDHFWIETWTQEADKNIYRKWVQYIDSSRVGALSLLEEDEWSFETQRTGTRVTIPFEQKDLDAVKNALEFYLSYTNAKFNFKSEEVDLQIERFWYSHFGSNWAMDIYEDSNSYWLSEKNKGLAIIEDIPYSINCQTLFKYFEHNIKDLRYIVDNQKPVFIEDPNHNRMLFEGFITSLKYHEFEIKLPIGSVDLNASREDLQYTDRTCRYLFDAFYKMFLEVYKFIRIDLIEHPNFPEACIQYEKHYNGGFKKFFLSEVLWAKESISFNTNPPLFKTKPSDTYKSYHLDVIYSEGSSNKKDVLRGGIIRTLKTGSIKYVIVIQDTDYTNFTKFLKYYAQKSDEDKYNIHYLCVGPKDYDKVYDWIIETTPTVKLSDLVADFKLNAPVISGNKAAAGSFKTLVYKGQPARSRAEEISAFFDYAEKNIEPDEESYYISWDQWMNPPEFFNKAGPYNAINKALKDYIDSKEISKSNLVLTKKVTRNFESDNWINFIDVLREDYKKYSCLYKDICLALYTCSLIERHMPVFKIYTAAEINHVDSMYINLQNFYLAKSKILTDNSEAITFFNLTNRVIRDLNTIRATSYFNFKHKCNLDFMEELQEEAFSIFEMYDNYLNQVPLLYFHDDYRLSSYDICPKDWVDYINLLEREKGLYKKRTQEQPALEFSEFSKLVRKLSLQYA
jgi:hypothetical protein